MNAFAINKPNSLLVLTIFILISFKAYNQDFSNHPIVLAPINKPIIDFNEKDFRDQFRLKYDKKFLFQTFQDIFEESVVNDLKTLYFENNVYSSLTDETTYILKVFKKAIPTELQDKNVKVYLIRNPIPNAFCVSNGIIGINIGWFSMINNESELTALLTHEFAHYFKGHELKSFKIYCRMRTFQYFISLIPYVGLMQQLPYLYYLQRRKHFEKQADLFGLKFLKSNGYSPVGYYSEFEKLMRLNKIRRIRKDERNNFSIYSTHPATKRRIKYIKRRTQTFTAGKLFQVDSLAFERTRKKCTDESIYFYFEKANYSNAIELAYKMHLMYPDDKFYFFMLFESLRRKIIIEPDTKNKRFITDAFKIRTSFSERKNRAARSIHYNLERIYGFTNSEISELKNKRLTDKETIEFISYQEAFDYFKTLAKTKFKDCYYSLIREKEKYDLPKDTVDTEFSKYLFDQTFSYDRETYSATDEGGVLFLNNVYTSKRGSKAFSINQIKDSSLIKTEFTRFLENKSENEMALMKKDFNPFPKLSYREYISVNNLLQPISTKLINDNFIYEEGAKKKHFYSDKRSLIQSPLNAFENFPELNMLSKKYNFKKIYFVDFLETTPSPLLNSARFKNKLNMLLYCIDFEKNTITRVYKKLHFKFKMRDEYSVIYPYVFEYLKEFSKM